MEKIRCLGLNSNILAIAMTGYGELDDKEQARVAGFDIHLFKPASVKQLKMALAQHLRKNKFNGL